MQYKYGEIEMTFNSVELLANSEEQYPSPCKHSNFVDRRACYCHHPDGYGKCPQCSKGKSCEDCNLFEEQENE